MPVEYLINKPNVRKNKNPSLSVSKGFIYLNREVLLFRLPFRGNHIRVICTFFNLYLHILGRLFGFL